jgi:sterol desaturase/sphingolipid hydroxylase (fatty acid hydroxylase superfamily)
MHPVDDLCDNVAVGLSVLAAGVSIEAWLATGPFVFFLDAWLHANLRLPLGPLRYVIATPAFHRAHHADDAAETSCNFAGVFPVWDLVFGTFRMPDDAPRSFGAGTTAVPAGFLAQLAFPLRVQAARIASYFADDAHG